MKPKLAKEPPNRGVLIGLGVAAIAAIVFVAYFVVQMNRGSGTIHPEIQQMKAGARGKKNS